MYIFLLEELATVVDQHHGKLCMRSFDGQPSGSVLDSTYSTIQY